MQQASSVHAAETLLFFTLLQLSIIVLAGRAGGAPPQRADSRAPRGAAAV